MIYHPQPMVKQLFRSAELQLKIEESENVIRNDYMNDNGKITFAADKGYATVIITKTEQGKIEEYFDENGKPVCLSNGQYAVLREYDEAGHNIRIVYLGIDGEPVMTASGYAIIERTYDEIGNMVIEKYYDLEEKPVCTTSYGFGKCNEYNDIGQVVRITYVDENDKPMMIGLGYAIITRNYYVTDDLNNGKVESEFYFDADGQPVQQSLGYYGVHKQYDENGQAAVITYLDAEGNPTVTTRGYTTIELTYYANNSIETEMFYNLNGEPFRLPEGQNGIRKVQGQTVTYLNENGQEQFNIKRLLYNQPILVIFSASAVVFVSVVTSRKINWIFLFLYIIVIAYITLFFREQEGQQANLELFWSYKQFFTSAETRSDIFKNIWLFIPLGAILFQLNRHKAILLVPLVLSVGVELIQYITGTGLLEFDDMLSNGLGGAIGFGAGCLLANYSEVFRRKWVLFKRRRYHHE